MISNLPKGDIVIGFIEGHDPGVGLVAVSQLSQTYKDPVVYSRYLIFCQTLIILFLGWLSIFLIIFRLLRLQWLR